VVLTRTNERTSGLTGADPPSSPEPPGRATWPSRTSASDLGLVLSSSYSPFAKKVRRHTVHGHSFAVNAPASLPEKNFSPRSPPPLDGSTTNPWCRPPSRRSEAPANGARARVFGDVIKTASHSTVLASASSTAAVRLLLAGQPGCPPRLGPREAAQLESHLRASALLYSVEQHARCF
jgi:hypothetical protein